MNNYQKIFITTISIFLLCMTGLFCQAQQDSASLELFKKIAVELMNSRVQQNVSSLEPGQMSPSFNFKDINNKQVKLEDFKGKYVYIDVWATWCAPCCVEIPLLQKLARKFRRKKIVFVSVSIDKDKKEWSQFVKKYNLEGVQLWTGGNITWTDAYQITSIPRFILIDKEGRIVNAKMTRPSDPETEKTLSNLKGI